MVSSFPKNKRRRSTLLFLPRYLYSQPPIDFSSGGRRCLINRRPPPPPSPLSCQPHNLLFKRLFHFFHASTSVDFHRIAAGSDRSKRQLGGCSASLECWRCRAWPLIIRKLQLEVRSGSDPPWRVRRKQSVLPFSLWSVVLPPLVSSSVLCWLLLQNFPIEIFRSVMLKANRGFAGDFFSFGFWLQQAWWLCAPPVDLVFSNSSVLQSFKRKLTVPCFALSLI